jgi:hypothetical protein
MEVKSVGNLKFDFLKIWEVQRKFLSESLIFSLLQFPLPFSNGKGTISWGLLAILLFVSLSTLFFSKGNKERFSLSYYCCAIPIIIIGTIVLNLPLPEIIVLFLFSMWRLKVFMNEDFDDEYEEFMGNRLVATLLIFVSMYFIGYLIQMPSRFMMIFFLMIQLFLFSYGTFVKRYLQSKGDLLNKKAFFSLGALLFLFPIAISFIITFLGGLIREGLSIILNKVFWFIAYLLNPVINVLTSYFGAHQLKLNKVLDDDAKKKPVVPDTGTNKGDMFAHTIQGHTFIFVGIVLIVIIALWAYLHFRKWNFKKETERENSIINKFTVYKAVDKSKNEEKNSYVYSKSNQQIRTYVLDLERYAGKMKIERHAFESVRDWLSRMNIGASDDWISMYEHVRYGSTHITQQELRQFVEEVKHIKKIIKETNKKTSN